MGLRDVSHLTAEDEISSQDWQALLSSPSLIVIDICNGVNLTDCVIERAFALHQFTSIEYLTLRNCNHVTRRAIDLFMNSETPIETIEIYDCVNISDEDIDLFQHFFLHFPVSLLITCFTHTVFAVFLFGAIFWNLHHYFPLPFTMTLELFHCTIGSKDPRKIRTKQGIFKKTNLQVLRLLWNNSRVIVKCNGK